MSDWPPLPVEIPAPRGPVRVVRVDRIPGKPDEDVLGEFDSFTRIIKIKKRLRREVAWDTLFHELSHCWIHDSSPMLHGRLSRNHKLNEEIQDAVALGLLHFLPSYLK